MAGKPDIADLSRRYTEWHWGQEPGKVIHVADTLCPDVVGIGELREIAIPSGVIAFPEGTWIAYDPRHPHERLHLILQPAYRERVRMEMKHATGLTSLQNIARAAGGTHVRYPLPNVQSKEIGVMVSVTYWTHKQGDPPSLYEHRFGEEWSKGVRPILAADCSGRMWVCGGSYRNPVAGISG